MKVRVRLTILFAVSLLIAGSIALLVNAFAYQDSVYDTNNSFSDAMLKELGVPRSVAEAAIMRHPELIFNPKTGQLTGRSGVSVDDATRKAQERIQARAARRSRIWTAIAIGGLTLAAAGIGWLISGRILRPVRLLTKRAQDASATNLDTRVSLEGPEDEFKELADTFDDMLDRLARSFVAQRRFSAQVSHELRTPLAVIGSEVDMLLADADDATTRTRLEGVRDATYRAERIVSALLVLARTESGDLQRRPIAIDELVGDIVALVAETSLTRSLRIDMELRPATMIGDPALLECLVRNLVDNAVRHNRADGWIHILVKTEEDAATPQVLIEVANSTVAATGDGAVLESAGNRIGLTVVDAVLESHAGTLDWERDNDAVTARVRFAALPAIDAGAAGVGATTDTALAGSPPIPPTIASAPVSP